MDRIKALDRVKGYLYESFRDTDELIRQLGLIRDKCDLQYVVESQYRVNLEEIHERCCRLLKEHSENTEEFNRKEEEP